MKLSECKPGTFVFAEDGQIGQIQQGIQFLSKNPGVIGVWVLFPNSSNEYLVDPKNLEKYEG